MFPFFHRIFEPYCSSGALRSGRRRQMHPTSHFTVMSLRPRAIAHRHARFFAKRAPRSPYKISESTQAHDDDFRPPWFFTTSHMLTYISVPGSLLSPHFHWILTDHHVGSRTTVVGLYCIFLADWGDHDHVFMPVGCR